MEMMCWCPLPTGYGKSLCFALLPTVFDILRDEHGNAIVLVISPLTSIIANQVTSFRAKEVAAAYAGDEDVATKKAIKMGKYQLVFISPESLFWNGEEFCAQKFIIPILWVSLLTKLIA